MRGGQQDTTSGLANADDMAGSGSAEDAVLANNELLDTVCGTDLCNDLSDLRVPVAAITTNDEGGALDALRDGEQDAGDERLGVVLALEDLDLLTKTRAGCIVSKLLLGKLQELAQVRLTFRASGLGKASGKQS